MYHKCSTTNDVHTNSRLTWVGPGLTEVHFHPILPHRCGHNSVDFPTYFLLDVAVPDASGGNAGVICSGTVQIHGVVVCLRADGAPLHPQGVVIHTIELEVGWTAGACRITSQHTDLFYIFGDELAYRLKQFFSLDENPRYLHSDVCPVLLMASRLTL